MPTRPQPPRHVLVTGGRGFVGRAVVARLLAERIRVTVLSSDPAATVPAGVDLVIADLTDPAALGRALAGRDIDAVCHLAARTQVRESFADPAGFYAVNVGGTAALLGALRRRARERGDVLTAVFASTAAVYGRRDDVRLHEDLPVAPTSPYAASKAAAEALLGDEAASGAVAAVTLRTFNVAGATAETVDRDTTRLVPRALEVAAGREPAFPLNGDGSAVREFVHVGDLAAAYHLALAAAQPGRHQIFNVGSGEGVAVRDVLAMVAEVTGRPVPVERRPPADEPRRLVADGQRVRHDLGWRPQRSDLRRLVSDAWQAVRVSP